MLLLEKSGYLTRKSLPFSCKISPYFKIKSEEKIQYMAPDLDFVTIQNIRRNIHTLYLTLPIQRVFYKKRKKRNILENKLFCKHEHFKAWNFPCNFVIFSQTCEVCMVTER